MPRPGGVSFSPGSSAAAHGEQSLEVRATKGDASRLESLVYFSTAVATPSVQQLDHMLLRARERNTFQGVTGVLVYSEGTFVQYLEGPRRGLDTVLHHIRRDPLHHSLFEVYREPIESREFAEWQMAFAPTLLSGLVKHFPVSDQLAKRLRATKDSLSGVRHLLNTSWGNGLGPRQGQWSV